MNRILVTGGAGFIGFNLCKKLLEDKNNFVICFDNLFTGQKRNVEILKKFENFEFIEGDIIYPIDVKCNQIYNLACPASPIHYQSDPIKTAQTCFEGALNVLNLAKENNATVLQASTSEVYGDPLIHPQIESYRGNVNPDGIRSCYDEGKRIAETLFFDFYRKYGTKIKVARIFNTYGPAMRPDDGRVVSNFIIQALNGEKITIYGSGAQTRSFCYVDDLVDALIKMMNSSSDFIGPVNLGNPGEFTVLELAELVLSKINTKSSIIFKELPKDDPTKRKPVIDLAKEHLKWEPTTSLNEGLDKTIEFFKNLK